MSSTHSKNEETLAVILEEINKKLDEEIKIRKAMQKEQEQNYTEKVNKINAGKNLKYSILSGALTVAIIILPVIIRTTEEALKTVQDGYREASLALGSTKFQTLYKVVLPSAIPGILSGVILSVGRVVGESAAILLTSGTVAQMPGGIFDSARNLTVHAYLLTKEKGDIASAASIGIVLIFIVLFLNTVAKFVAKKLNKANY